MKKGENRTIKGAYRTHHACINKNIKQLTQIRSHILTDLAKQSENFEGMTYGSTSNSDSKSFILLLCHF